MVVNPYNIESVEHIWENTKEYQFIFISKLF